MSFHIHINHLKIVSVSVKSDKVENVALSAVGSIGIELKQGFDFSRPSMSCARFQATSQSLIIFFRLV